jgi:hypothetical protein
MRAGSSSPGAIGARTSRSFANIEPMHVAGHPLYATLRQELNAICARFGKKGAKHEVIEAIAVGEEVSNVVRRMRSHGRL